MRVIVLFRMFGGGGLLFFFCTFRLPKMFLKD